MTSNFMAQRAKRFWVCPICGPNWCCRCKISHGQSNSSWSWVNYSVCRRKQKETCWNESKRTHKVRIGCLYFLQCYLTCFSSRVLLSCHFERAFVYCYLMFDFFYIKFNQDLGIDHMIIGDLHEPIHLVQTILLQDKGDITSLLLH